MWGTILQVNSILWVIAGIYFIYSIGAAILIPSWKQFLLGLLIFVFFTLAEVALAAIAEP